jgi:serine/threonine-protein kinase RsbW
MADPAILKEVTLTLQMAPDMEVEACENACAVARSVMMSPDKIDEVKMAVVEACINALEHSQAPDHKIEIQFAVLGARKPEQLRITVRDAGVGFDPKKLVEPHIEEKIKALNKRGWGLRIIQGLMDDVHIKSGEDGTTVVMSKRL